VTSDLKENFNIKNRISTIFNPVDLEEINKHKKMAVDFDFSRFTFISIGRLDQGKNHKLMIKGFSRLKNKNTQLIIIGDGTLKSDLEQYIKKLNLENRVYLAGYMANPYSWLHRSDCFVLASNYESFGIVLIEALACNLPVISTDCQSGPREILSPDSKSIISDKGRFEICRHGILSRVNDMASLKEAMDYLINTPILLKEFKKKALKRASDFDSRLIKKLFVKAIE
jgi:N-acetylgalactosamine-N,N'-diacetylbacillosaminyl-diphospho-undecaprenol 4-alpha-N-acetylgalactosaminyltransferase